MAATATRERTDDIDLCDADGALVGRLAVSPGGSVKGLVLRGHQRWIPCVLVSVSKWESWVEARLASEFHRPDGPTAGLASADRAGWYVVSIKADDERPESYSTYVDARGRCSRFE